MQMAGVTHKTSSFFQPYDDYPFIVMMTIEDWGFAKKGKAGASWRSTTSASMATSLC